MIWRGFCVHNSGALWSNVQCLFPLSLLTLSVFNRRWSGPGSWPPEYHERLFPPKPSGVLIE